VNVQTPPIEPSSNRLPAAGTQIEGEGNHWRAKTQCCGACSCPCGGVCR
jgi:hypothetical protein